MTSARHSEETIKSFLIIWIPPFIFILSSTIIGYLETGGKGGQVVILGSYKRRYKCLPGEGNNQLYVINAQGSQY